MEHGTAQVRGPAGESAASVAQRVGLWVVGAVALVAVVGAPAAASWHGLVGFARRELGLTGGWEYLVPVALDGAALYAAVLAMRAILAGDSAIWPRLLTCAYALAAAGFNAHAAPTEIAALFYAGMSISAAVLWDATLRALRRDQLRELGAIQGVAARYRPLRWLLAPDETGRAWRTAVLEDIPDARTALRVVRGRVSLEQLEQDRAGGVAVGELVQAESSRLPDDDPPDGPPRGGPDGGGEYSAPVVGLEAARAPLALTVGTKADAIRAAFDAIGRRDVPAALAWLAERGVTVDRSYAYTVRPRLRSAAGGER
ncbi:MAG: DUF2637 domain-containing protein [Pseudonocardia sp.]